MGLERVFKHLVRPLAFVCDNHTPLSVPLPGACEALGSPNIEYYALRGMEWGGRKGRYLKLHFNSE